MKQNNIRLVIIAVLLIVNLIYGATFSIVKVVVPEYIGAFGIIVFRVVVSAIIFWIIYLFHFEKVNWTLDWWRFALSAFTGVAFNQLLFLKGLSITSAVNGAIIMTLAPIFVLVWQAIITKQAIRKIKIIGILIGMIGALIIIYNPNASFGANWIGDLLVLGNAVSYSFYLVIVKPLMQKYNPLTVVTWIFTFGSFVVIPVGFSDIAAIDFNSFTPTTWGSLIYVVFAATVIVYLMNGWAISKANPAVVGAFIYLQPVFATITAVIFFSEIFLFKHLIAAFFVFFGVWLVTKKERKKTR